MWSSYRKCTGCTSFCNVFLGVALVVLWVTCFQWCLSRLNAENDLAAPLCVGIVSVLVGSFGLLASCMYWKRRYETVLFVLTLITAICSAAAIVLSVHATFKEHLLYESQGRPLEGLGDGVFAVALFGVMAVFSFALFLTSVTWACMCFFKRLKRQRQDDEDYDFDGAEAAIWAYHNSVVPGQIRSPTTGARRSNMHAGENETETPGRSSAPFTAPGYRARQGNAGTAQHGGDDAAGPGASASAPGASASAHRSAGGPRFASVAAAELRWWDYYTPPKEKAGFGGF